LDPIMFNQRAGAVKDNIVACNGAIYIIDDVLVPGKCRVQIQLPDAVPNQTCLLT